MVFEIDPFKKKPERETGRKGVEAKFVEAVRLNKGKAYKFTSEMNRGVSDRIVIIHNQTWFVEIKVTNGKLTPLQKSFKKFIESQNQNHFVVYGMEGIKEFLKEVAYAKSRKA